MEPEIDIVIVNWNAGPLLRKCIASIGALGEELRRIGSVTIVDNASTDGSCDDLPDCDGRLAVVRCSENKGFARACNIGARSATGRYVLFLNPDTELPGGVLSRAVQAAANERDEPSVVGVRMLGPDGSVMKTCARFPTVGRLLGASIGLDRVFPSLCPPHLMLEWDHSSTRPVDQVMGAFFLVRLARFRELGGFDERFFVYYEELDYCVRAARAGRRALHLGDVTIHHVGQGTSRQIGGIAIFYAARSKIIYARKHFGFFSFALIAATTLTLEFLTRMVAAAVNGNRRDIRNTLVAFQHLWRWAATGRPGAAVQSATNR
jgi:N-acetylglucosaminyl-diphospho-decaprenol L-rhamnosyltransferase